MFKQRTRREFLTDTTGFAAATLLARRAMAGAHRVGDDTIRLALVGCGSRGGGAARDALSVTRGPLRLVAMADVFEDRLKATHEALTESLGKAIDVPPD